MCVRVCVCLRSLIFSTYMHYEFMHLHIPTKSYTYMTLYIYIYIYTYIYIYIKYTLPGDFKTIHTQVGNNKFYGYR